MDFVLGPDPKNWTTGKAPPSPASEFVDTTAPSAIITPGKVSTLPSAVAAKKDHHERKRLRDIAFALMTLGLVSVITGTAAAVWWFRYRKPKNSVIPEADDQEKGQQDSNEGEKGVKATETKTKTFVAR